MAGRREEAGRTMVEEDVEGGESVLNLAERRDPAALVDSAEVLQRNRNRVLDDDVEKGRGPVGKKEIVELWLKKSARKRKRTKGAAHEDGIAAAGKLEVGVSGRHAIVSGTNGAELRGSALAFDVLDPTPQSAKHRLGGGLGGSVPSSLSRRNDLCIEESGSTLEYARKKGLTNGISTTSSPLRPRGRRMRSRRV
jgi:hypothetical protein